MFNAYRSDMERARARFDATPSQNLETGTGTIEYLHTGAGTATLFSHGVLGSHLDAVHSVELWVGSGVRAVCPSRFGYFGSTLRGNAEFTDQADAYVELLDHLGIERVLAVGFSAGGPSVIDLALRHPDRVSGLVLCSSRLPGLPKPNDALKPVLRYLFGAERLFWIYKKLLPKTYAQMMGIPKSFVMTDEDHRVFDPIADSFFPLKPRRDGAIWDAFTSNQAVDDLPLERIAVPTLILHSADDPLALYPSAQAAASRIHDARLVTFERGGHLFLGHDDEVRREISAFMASIQPREVVQA